MKITPLEIRQKDFEKNFRGYDKDEVNAFLQTLSQEWERTVEENKEMRYKLEASQREVEKLREVESSLYKTLKTAEDTGANMIEQAQKTAELKLKEANLESEKITSEAKARAKKIVDQAESRAQEIILKMEERVKALRQNYKAIESDYDNLLFELRSMAQKTLQRIDKAENDRQFNIDKKVEEAERLVEEYNSFLYQQKTSHEERKTAKKNDQTSPAPPPYAPQERKKGNSFFDNLD